MIDERSQAVSGPASRRRLLRLLGAGGAALVASMLPRNGVRAGHDGTNVFHLGESNFANDSTQLDGDFAPATGTTPAFGVFGHGQVAIGIIGHADHGTGIAGSSDGGLEGEPGSIGFGVSGAANHDGIGVRGESLSADGVLEDQDGAGPGVLGLSGTGFGVEGRSKSGTGVAGSSWSGPGGEFLGTPGVVGHGGVQGFGGGAAPGGAFESENGAGVVATSKDGGAVVGFSDNGSGGSFSSGNGIGVRGFIQGSGGPGVLGAAPGEAPGVRALSASFAGPDFGPDNGLALDVVGRANFEADVAEAYPFFFRNSNAGEGAHVIVAQASGLKPAIAGTSDADGGVGIVGSSDGPDFAFAGGTGDGVWGASGSGAGVVGRSEDGPGVRGESQSAKGIVGISEGSSPGAVGVHGHSAGGVGIRAEGANVALEVLGKARFSNAGSGAVPAGNNSVTVVDPAITAESHVTVTLTSDPGPRQLLWLERNAGTGFTVHLTSAPPPQRPTTSFTYLITEPVV